MPVHRQTLFVVLQRLERELVLGEGLLFPEASTLDARKGSVVARLGKQAVKLIRDLTPVTSATRRLGSAPTVAEVEFSLPPPNAHPEWKESVALRFPYLVWEQGREGVIASVPSLGIEVLSETRDALPKLVIEQIRQALQRIGASRSLEALARLQRCESLEVEATIIETEVLSPKERAQEAEKAAESKKQILPQLATNLVKRPGPRAYEVEPLVARLGETLSGAAGGAPQSVLLVGPSGVGKTALVGELVHSRDRRGLAKTAFWSTSGARLMSGASGFGMWQQQCLAIIKEAGRGKAVVHLGNLVELVEVGKGGGRRDGVASFLRPYIARGELLTVVEATPEQLEVVEREDPTLLDAFVQIRLPEPTSDQVRAILLHSATESRSSDVEVEALEAIDRLHRRYASYSAPPGRPLRFLDNLLRDRESSDGPVNGDEVGRAFSRETGLPRVLLDDSVRLDLNETRRWFGTRIAGQNAAVELVVELIAAVKAGLTRPGRPIASLLFIGPTGVGKTETAKALAEFLYQDPQRMVRFDMSEYADAYSIDRLVGGSFAQQGLLTAKVREQPFGVILFDEFEKADPLFFDLLLQILGDGRLTDSVGRTADFSNAVIVMTSNLGAEEFQRASIGFDDRRRTSAAQEHFAKKVRDFLRPEIYNRIDRIVPFAPLDPAMLLAIARRQLDAIRRRDGLQGRNLAFDVPEDVLVALAESAYDPRYGARPLVRAMERSLLTPLAAQINRWRSTMALTATVSLSGGSANVLVEPQRDVGGRLRYSTDDFQSLMDAASDATNLRRDAQLLAGSGSLIALRNAVDQMESAAKSKAKAEHKKRKSEMPWEAYTPQPKYRRFRTAIDRTDELLNAAIALEEETLLDFYARRPGDPSGARARFTALTSNFNQLLLDVYLAEDPAPSEALLVVFGEERETTLALALAYLDVVKRQGGLASCWLLNRATTPEPLAGATRLMCLPSPEEANALLETEAEANGVETKSKSSGKNTPEADASAAQPAKPTFIDAVRLDEQFLRSSDPALGVALALSVPAARPLFHGESGVHVFRRGGHDALCLVQVGPNSVMRYRPPFGVDRRGTFAQQSRRRTYDWDKERILDPTLGAWPGTPDTLAEALHETTVKLLAQRLREEVLG